MAELHDMKSTLPSQLKSAAVHFADRVWIDIDNEQFTFARVEEEAARYANGFLSLGIRKGDRVCTMLDNHVESIWAWLGLSKIGAVLVPINTALKGEFLRHQVTDSGACLLVAETEYAERLIELQDQLPAVRALLHRGSVPSARAQWPLLPIAQLRGDVSGESLPTLKASDLAMLIYTSGTTGPAKACMISYGYLTFYGSAVARENLMTAKDVIWCPTPMFHISPYGLLMSSLLLRIQCCIGFRFSLSSFWPEMERTGATIVMLVGIMIPLVADGPDCDAMKRCHGQLRRVIGAPFTAVTERKWQERFGIPRACNSGFGMTESALNMSNNAADDPPPGSSGKPIAEFEARIVDDDDQECPPGVPGELVLRPRYPRVMFDGYWNRPEATVEALRNLWFHTGDLGKFDENGYFWFVDRKKDYLRRGGENISSFEMESTIRGHEAIAAVAVHSVPSDLAEDEVKVTAVLHPGKTLTAEELFRWAIDRVPYFALPRYIEFRSELPMNASNRVLKYQLRSDGVTPSTWDRTKAAITYAKR